MVKELRHGLIVTYIAHKCRCLTCRLGMSTYLRAKHAERVRRGLAPDDPRHGKYTTYNTYNCRCEACTKAMSDKRKQMQQAKLQPSQTSDRVPTHETNST